MSEDASSQNQLIDDRYRVVREIAQGGMATVYEAVDERLNRTVALKVMHTQLAQGAHREQFIERFRREAQSAARIANPHIVQVYDTGEFNGLAYLVMEYVHGVNLRYEMNQQGTFTVRETLRVIGETLDGLASAHQANVVHRDIKPENIMLNDRGRVQITDFGLAKVASAATLSSTGMLLGTAAYLPPETIERNEATPQGDLYAVGIMAWEMLSGSVPFVSENPVTLVFKHVHEDVPPVSQQCPGIDEGVSRFIEHLTQRSVEARPADAGAALAELQGLCGTLSADAWMYRKPADGGAVPNAAGAPIPPAPPAPPAATANMASDANTAQFAGTGAGTGTSAQPNATTPINAGSTQVFGAPNAGTPGEHETVAMPGNNAAKNGKRKTAAASKRGRKALIIAIIALVAALACAGGAWWYFMGPGSYWTMPKPADVTCTSDSSCSLQGASWKRYESTLKDAGIPYEVTKGYSDTVEEGHVISASVNGSPVAVDSHISMRQNQKVNVVVSKGVRMVTIPSDILDPTSANGKNPLTALKNAGFTNVKHDTAKDEYSMDVPEGAALSITPKPGVTIKHGATVKVALSKGPMPVTMPDITGRAKDEAERTLDDLKLKANFTEEYSDTVASGEVISTSVPKDTQLHWGDSVDVVVSKGPETVTMPNVVGKTYEEASNILQALGLEVKKSAPLGDLTHVVRLQSPNAGDQVRVRDDAGNKTVVTLTVV
ncbi:PASTA domain-containing protein [Bifidobacterium sp. 64T4]|uniref:Stk1 family PASTA domain-containing Ser/Thr kinase n=1 Tax=Bifidobacterium pongonis TaxID=2834432 RepID=UPI001C57ED9D|nr:Stk1 family PASTA domain-containing Ser/Thr kinase [Bifidobacterium pongonis]MBW3095247.1 PASTA domain-containing protein [Bifidobacterium pongonis]